MPTMSELKEEVEALHKALHKLGVSFHSGLL